MEALRTKRLRRIRTVLRYALVVFMFLAGINHFINPLFYLPLIPDYLPWPQLVNVVSGALEITFSLLVLNGTMRKFGVYGILFLLILFIPSHLHFIQLGACIENALCTPLWVAWIRLLVIHPILFFWVWSIGKT